MKALYLDESGDHNLIVVDPQYPIFVLGGVIVDQDYAEGPLTEALNDFKREMFGRTDIVLHTADIVRNRNGFEALMDGGFRRAFYDRLNALMSSLDYSVVACAIRKDEHVRRFGPHGKNLYFLGLDILVEQFCFAVGNVHRGGSITAESRDATLDRSLEVAWLDMKIRGTDHLEPSLLNYRIRGLDLRTKKENLAGLQLADLVVSPIGRHVIGRPDNRDWAIVESKLWRNRSGRTRVDGLVTLPQ